MRLLQISLNSMNQLLRKKVEHCKLIVYGQTQLLMRVLKEVEVLML